MTSLTVRNGRWIGKTRVPGLAPMVLVRVSIVLMCLTQSLKAGSEIRRELAWRDLPAVLARREGHRHAIGGGSRPWWRMVVVQENAPTCPRSPWPRTEHAIPCGFEASIPRESVKEFRVEKVLEDAAIGGAVVGAIAAFGLTGLTLLGARWDPRLEWTTLLVSPVGGGFLGHQLGKRLGRKTTIITVR